MMIIGCRVPHPCAAFCARVGFHSRRPVGIFSRRVSHIKSGESNSGCL